MTIVQVEATQHVSSPIACSANDSSGSRRLSSGKNKIQQQEDPPSPRNKAWSPRSLKRHHQVPDQTPNRKLLFGVLFGLYIVVALCFLLKYVLEPTQASLLANKCSKCGKSNVDSALTADNMESHQNLELELTIKGSKGEVTKHRATMEKQETTKNELPKLNFRYGTAGGFEYRHCGFPDNSSLFDPTTSRSSSFTVHNDGSVTTASKDNDVERSESRDIIILDGGRTFTQHEQQEADVAPKNSEQLFSELCDGLKNRFFLRSVTAVSVSQNSGGTATTEELLSILRDLKEQELILSYPVAAIITPGCASNTIVDWLLFGEMETLTNTVMKHWISSNLESVLQAVPNDYNNSHDSIKHASASLRSSSGAMQEIDRLPVLAIHGSSDTKSKLIAGILETQASVQVAEIDGAGEYSYADSPLAFSEAVLGYLAAIYPATSVMAKYQGVVAQPKCCPGESACQR